MSKSEKKLKIICLQENIKNSLVVSERISGNNLSLPILNNTLIETGNGFLKISSTDLEIGVEVMVSCRVEVEGSVVVPTKTLLNLINKLPNTKLKMEDIGGKVEISTDDTKTNIPIMDKEDFPIIPKIKNGFEININSKIIKKALEQVLNSTASIDSKPEISGVLFDFKKNILSIVATDSFRLSEKTIINNGEIYKLENNESFILPKKTAQELVKILDLDDDLKIIIGDGQVSFYFDKISLISRIIDGEYPNYKQIIPNSYKTSIILNKDEFTAKLKLASVFSSNINDVKFQIDAKNKKFKISSKDNIKGEFVSEVEFNELEGDDIEAVFNFRYLLDGLLSIENSDIELKFNGSAAPALIKSKKQEDYIYIVMPIRL
jgi:DNA polymerase-3 subunit beta